MPAHLADERFELQALPAGERWDAWRSVLAATHLPWRAVPGPEVEREPARGSSGCGSATRRSSTAGATLPWGHGGRSEIAAPTVSSSAC